MLAASGDEIINDFGNRQNQNKTQKGHLLLVDHSTNGSRRVRGRARGWLFVCMSRLLTASRALPGDSP